MNISKYETFVQKLDKTSLFVVDTSIPKSDYTRIDLSKDNESLQKVDITSADKMERFIIDYIESKKAQVAFGGYLEHRNLYQRSSHFNQQIDPNDERNIHLGVDIWKDAGTKVLAILDGEIHSFQNNTNFGDYGPTIILKHQFEDVEFYSLYGHLSLDSIANLKIRQKIQKGEVIGKLGDASVNGDYAPHLHFQVILDIENFFGDYPGVSSLNQLDFYRKNCPNPEKLLGL
jgi:murein DD-endopeptidase MepM/ murein hydrolase activator NlpD